MRSSRELPMSFGSWETFLSGWSICSWLQVLDRLSWTLLFSLVDRMNRFLHIYLLNLFSFMFLMLAIAGVGIIVDSKSVGWPAAIISNMGFPSYCFVVLACWTNMGEYFTESVSELFYLKNKVFNCFLLLVCRWVWWRMRFIIVTGWKRHRRSRSWFCSSWFDVRKQRK